MPFYSVVVSSLTNTNKRYYYQDNAHSHENEKLFSKAAKLAYAALYGISKGALQASKVDISENGGAQGGGTILVNFGNWDTNEAPIVRGFFSGR